MTILSFWKDVFTVLILLFTDINRRTLEQLSLYGFTFNHYPTTILTIANTEVFLGHRLTEFKLSWDKTTKRNIAIFSIISIIIIVVESIFLNIYRREDILNIDFFAVTFIQILANSIVFFLIYQNLFVKPYFNIYLIMLFNIVILMISIAIFYYNLNYIYQIVFNCLHILINSCHFNKT